MEIFEEVEKIIAELPPIEASSLKVWLNEFQAARRYKHIKAYMMATQAIVGLKKVNGDPLWN